MPNTIGERMPKIMESHARNALHLAETFNRIPGCDVSHPNLPQHANGELATQLAPQGSVTLFYVTLPEGVPANEFMQQVKDVAGDRIGLGTSFGHSKTWLSNYGLDSRTVRVAAGSEPEEESHEVASVFYASFPSVVGLEKIPGFSGNFSLHYRSFFQSRDTILEWRMGREYF